MQPADVLVVKHDVQVQSAQDFPLGALVLQPLGVFAVPVGIAGGGVHFVGHVDVHAVFEVLRRLGRRDLVHAGDLGRRRRGRGRRRRMTVVLLFILGGTHHVEMAMYKS